MCTLSVAFTLTSLTIISIILFKLIKGRSHAELNVSFEFPIWVYLGLFIVFGVSYNLFPHYLSLVFYALLINILVLGTIIIYKSKKMIN